MQLEQEEFSNSWEYRETKGSQHPAEELPLELSVPRATVEFTEVWTVMALTAAGVQRTVQPPGCPAFLPTQDAA